MTAKEKALELVEIFRDALPYHAGTYASRCASLCVSEIALVAPVDRYENLAGDLGPEDVGLWMFAEYWEEVKKEIELL